MYGLAYTYTGYPMVREARARIAAGQIGRVRKVLVEYLQGWLAFATEGEENKQAAWRLDSSKAGLGGCIGDIGVHAFNLAEFITGDRISEINPMLYAIVPGRTLDDDCTSMLRFASGATGVLSASQVALGESNALTIRIYGETGAIEWRQETPDRLKLAAPDCGATILRGGMAGVSDAAQAASRLPSGHPEGYLEAFANIYRDMAQRLRGTPTPLQQTIVEGVRSMRFVTSAVRGNGAGWVSLESEG